MKLNELWILTNVISDGSLLGMFELRWMKKCVGRWGDSNHTSDMIAAKRANPLSTVVHRSSLRLGISGQLCWPVGAEWRALILRYKQYYSADRVTTLLNHLSSASEVFIYLCIFIYIIKHSTRSHNSTEPQKSRQASSSSKTTGETYLKLWNIKKRKAPEHAQLISHCRAMKL